MSTVANFKAPRLQNIAGFYIFIPSGAKPNFKAKQAMPNPSALNIINHSIAPALAARPYDDGMVHTDDIMSQSSGAAKVKKSAMLPSDANKMSNQYPNHDIYMLPDYVVDSSEVFEHMTQTIAAMLDCSTEDIDGTIGW